MDNPGLKLHAPEPFLKVSNRRLANPIMRAPQTNDSVSSGGVVVPPEPETFKDNVMHGPPSASSNTPGPNATNGAPPIAGPTVLPDIAQTSVQRRIDTQKQVGGGEKENPAYDAAQQRVRNKVQVRRAHPLHQARKAEDWPDDYDLMAHEHELGPDPLADSVLNPEGQVHSPWHTPDVYVPPIRHIDPRSPQYDADYNKGWDASDSYGRGDWDDPDSSALDRMDDSNASHAAYDGYMDRAVGREKYHYRAVRRLGLDNPEDLPDEHWDYPEKVASVRTAAQFPDDDPVYPYHPQERPEEDTVDLDNPQTGDDTYTNRIQRTMRPSDNDLLDAVFGPSTGEETPEHERSAQAHENFFKALQNMPSARRDLQATDLPPELVDRLDAEDVAGQTNAMMDKALGEGDKIDPATGITPNQKAHVDNYVKGIMENHKQKVKRLQDEWRERGGRKTGEPMPVARFDPRLTHKGGQKIVPTEGNPFPELEHPIYYVGKCEGCGQTLFDGEDVSGDPRGALGSHTVGSLDAREYDATDGPHEGDRRMHGPSALICPDCDADERRQERILDRYRGHKAGEMAAGGRWTRDENGRQQFVPNRYTSDKSGIWHNPGEQVGNCPQCNKGETGFYRMGAQDQGTRKLPGQHRDAAVEYTNRVLNRITHPLYSGLQNGHNEDLSEAPSRLMHEGVHLILSDRVDLIRTANQEDSPTTPEPEQVKAMEGMGFIPHEDSHGTYWVKTHQGNDYVIGPSREEPTGGYWETSIGPIGHAFEDTTDPVEPMTHSDFNNAFHRVLDPEDWHQKFMGGFEAPWEERRRPGETRPFDAHLRDQVIQPPDRRAKDFDINGEHALLRPVNPGLQSLNKVEA